MRAALVIVTALASIGAGAYLIASAVLVGGVS